MRALALLAACAAFAGPDAAAAEMFVRAAGGRGFGYGAIPFDNDDPRTNGFADSAQNPRATVVSLFGIGSGWKAHIEAGYEVLPGFFAVAGAGATYLPLDRETRASSNSFGSTFFAGPIPTPIAYTEEGTRFHSATLVFLPVTIGVEARTGPGRVQGYAGIGAGLLFPQVASEWTEYRGTALMDWGAGPEPWELTQTARARFAFGVSPMLYEVLGLQVQVGRGVSVFAEARFTHASLSYRAASLSANLRAENQARSQFIDASVESAFVFSDVAPLPDPSAPEYRSGNDSCLPYRRRSFDNGQAAYTEDCALDLGFNLTYRRTERQHLARLGDVDAASLNVLLGVAFSR